MPILIVSFIFFLIMTSIAIYVFFIILHKKKFCKFQTTAEITDIEKTKFNWYTNDITFTRKRFNANKETYYPVYTFYVNTHKYEVKGNVGLPYLQIKIGNKVNLYYNKDNPTQIYVPTENEVKIFLRYMMLGFLFLVIDLFPICVYLFFIQ